MAYDEKLVARIRRAAPPQATERKMFGGIAFLLDGKMFVGVATEDMMVRVGPDAYEAALAKPHVRPMDFTGRPLTGYVYVGVNGTRTAAAVAAWVERAIAFVRTVKKAPKKRRQRRVARTSRLRA